MRNFLRSAIGGVSLIAASSSLASAVPILGSNLASFAVLGASDVTCVPTCVIGGNLGSSPTAPTAPAANFSFTSGSYQPGNQGTAQTELDAAILALNSMGVPILLGSGDLTSLGPIGPGNYTVPNAAINISGALTLDGGGSNSAVWIFHFPATTLTTSATSVVSVINVGDGANVGLYWDVGTTAVLNGPIFAGNILAGASITSDGDLTIACGRLLAATAAVTLIQDNISITGCGNASNGFDQGTGSSNGVPILEPATLALFGLGLTGLVAIRRRRAA